MNVIVFLIAHFLGDFILQPGKLVQAKNEKNRYIVIHSVIYSVLFMIALSMFLSITETLIATVIVFILHFLIDWLRVKSDNETRSNKFRFISFILDQISHIIIILLINSLVYTVSENPNNFVLYFNQIFTTVDAKYIALIILSYIIILTPSSVLIKHFLSVLFNDEEGEDIESSNNSSVGAVIGMLERVLILTLGLLGLYSSIAIVIAAKSLARFKQLEDRDFAEKYLVGTLLSLVIAIICISMVTLFK